MEFINIEKLPKEVQKAVSPLLIEFVLPNKAIVESVFVYGSATGKNFISKKSDINLAIVVKSIDLALLDRALKPVAWAGRQRVQAPLIVTREHIESSTDVFPIEFFDMKENHVLLYGQDVLSTLVVKDEHIRLFCEQQIKGKLIRIRQTYLEVGLKRKGIEALLKDSLNALIPVFRRLLSLKGIDATLDVAEILKQIGTVFQIDPSMMIAIWKDQNDDEQIAGKGAREVFSQYIQELEKLAQKVDQL